MSIAKIKIAVGAVTVAGLGAGIIWEHHAVASLRQQNQALEQQAIQLRQAVASGPSSSNLPGAAVDPATAREAQLQDLARLRREIDTNRQSPGELARLRAQNRDLRAVTDEPDDPVEAEFKQQTEMRATHLKQWGLSFLLYARDHNGQMPETFEQAAGVQGSESLLEFGTNHFEIVYRGSIDNLKDPGNTLVFREKEARRSPKGEWVKVYGIADGHVETRTEPDETRFAAWEREHILVAPGNTNTYPTKP